MAVGASVSHKIVGWDSDVHINPSNAAADAKKPKILDMVLRTPLGYTYLPWQGRKSQKTGRKTSWPI